MQIEVRCYRYFFLVLEANKSTERGSAASNIHSAPTVATATWNVNGKIPHALVALAP